jgi:ribosomal protein S18 acetylase RimI-like enzyme
LIIRRISPSDSLEDLTRLLHRAYAGLLAQGLRYVATHQDVATTRSRIACGECYVAEVEASVVATVTFREASVTAGCEWYDRTDVASFGQLAVAPEYQQRGIGTALLDSVEERARATGAAEISLDTSERAKVLIDWYIRRGYRVVQTADWEATNYVSVILSKPVAGRA